jgi:hypothetical protein
MIHMEKEKTVDELLEELGWGWLPEILFVVWIMVYFVVNIVE